MKKREIISILILLLYILITSYTKEKEIQQMNIVITELKTEIAEWDTLIPLYHEHLSVCSFIERDDVYIGKHGQLYSQYVGKYFKD